MIDSVRENNTVQTKTSHKSIDQSTQSQINNSKTPKSLIIYLAIVLALIVGGTGGYLLGLANCFRRNSQPIQKSTTLPTPLAVPSVNQLQQRGRILMEKEIEGGQIAAYRFSEDISDGLFAHAVAIVLEAGERHPVIFSSSSPGFSSGEIFEIIGNEIWVVNGETNKIDIYTYQVIKEVKGVLYPNSFTYKDSVSLPKYNVGVVYSIKCEKENCVVSTAHHQESGCIMDLNLTTRQYSNIKCSRIDGEFVPEPL